MRVKVPRVGITKLTVNQRGAYLTLNIPTDDLYRLARVQQAAAMSGTFDLDLQPHWEPLDEDTRKEMGW